VSPTLSGASRLLRGEGPGAGGQAIINLHLDKRRIGRAIVPVVPGVVKDFKLG
jgi:hypothetical protein